MTTASEALAATWASIGGGLSATDGYFRRRVALTGASAVHAGIHGSSGRRALFFEVEKRHIRGHRLIDETKGYSVAIAPDAAEREAFVEIQVVQTARSDGHIFATFASDILGQWISHNAAHEALAALESRLATWKRFFQRDARLSREDYIGLYGELSFIELASDAGMPLAESIRGWGGGAAANQDFLFGVTAVEVKTVTANTLDRVRISNLRQLDDTALADLFLIRFGFDMRPGAGRTLPQLVALLRQRVAEKAPQAEAEFGDKLLGAGLVPGVAHDLDEQGFTVRNIAAYRVREGFPRIREADLPAGISDVTYALDLASASAFRLELDQLWSSGALRA